MGALCYEDILLMVVRHPQTGEDVLAMSITFIHHKGADNKPKPYDPPESPQRLLTAPRQDHFLFHHDKKADLLPYHHHRQPRSLRRRVPGAEFDQCQTGLSDEEPGPHSMPLEGVAEKTCFPPIQWRNHFRRTSSVSQTERRHGTAIARFWM